MSKPHTVTSLAALAAIYGEPSQMSLRKEVPQLTAEYRRLIEAAPFFAFASAGPGGLDCSPRGDAPGFVRILDDRTLAIPDRSGNNRVDTLRNIIADPRVALLFLIPGCGETLRINGRASITTEPELLASFAVDGKRPRTVVLVAIDRAYYQCAKAVMRSRLWDPAARIDRASLPTPGEIQAGIGEGIDAEAYDARMPRLLQDTMY